MTESERPRRKTAELHFPALNNARKEHQRVMEVVEALGSKIGVMKEKQKKEHIEAYVAHMEEVQVELTRLRHLVATIKNDSTKEEKIKQLKEDQVFYRDEATRLDAKCTRWRAQIRDLASVLHHKESERDWYLKKLREHRKKFKLLRRRKKYMEGVENVSSDEESEFSEESNNYIQRKGHKGVKNEENSGSGSSDGGALKKIILVNDLKAGNGGKVVEAATVGGSQNMHIFEYQSEMVEGEEEDGFLFPKEGMGEEEFLRATWSLNHGEQQEMQRPTTTGGSLIRKKTDSLGKLVKNRLILDGLRSLSCLSHARIHHMPIFTISSILKSTIVLFICLLWF